METKLCKHCQTEIPKKAKVCPNCKKKQGGILKWIIIIIIVLILFGSLSGGSENSSNDQEATGNQELSANDGSANSNDIETDSEQQNDLDKVITAGDTFEANGLKVTINDISTDFTDYEDEYGWYTPEEGMKYVMVSFTYENTGNSDAYVSIYDYDCYADGTLCEQTYNFNGDFINANLSSGRNVSFETHYVVPVDAVEIELEYTSNIWTSEKVIIKIQ